MSRKDLLLSKTRVLLDERLWPMAAKVDKPRQRFLRQSIRRILLSGSLVVTELCHWIIKRINKYVVTEIDYTDEQRFTGYDF